MSNRIAQFSALRAGQRFRFKEDYECVKLNSELCIFENLDGGKAVRLVINNEEAGFKAVGRAAVVFNAVEISTGRALSVLDTEEVEYFDKYSEILEDTPTTEEETLTNEDEGYTL
jgi:hypothetical protein